MTVQAANKQLAQVCAAIPLDAKPGHTPIKIRTDLTHAIEIIVPEIATPGKTLVLTKFEKDGWQIGFANYSLPENIECEIPRDATPGVTELPVKYKGTQVTTVLVPDFAKPGVDDLLVVRPDDACDPWSVILCQDPDHPEAVKEMAIGASQTALRAPPLNPDLAFLNLAEALREAGAYVNPKIMRGRAPPLNVPGILAREDIAEGERIFSIPKDLHVSTLSGAKHLPAFFEDTTIPKLPQQSSEEAARYALVTRLLHEAEERAEAREAGKEVSSEGNLLAKVDPKVRRVWEAYMDQLLSEDFAHHPLRKMGENPEAMQEQIRPSAYSTQLYKEVRRVHTLYREILNNSKVLDGQRFERGMFLRTMLNFQSRQFKAAVSASLIPGSDLLNHAPADQMSVQWMWREDIQEHVLTCVRSVSAGTELLQSYGCHSNSSFYRCYSFTMPPQREQAWCYSLWKDDAPAVYAEQVPDASAAMKSEVHLTTTEISQSLRDLLTEIAKAGGNAAFFLRSICTAHIRPFEESKKLQPAIASLRLMRSKDPTSAAWWEHLSGPDAAMVDDEMVRIQMSDYMCLVAYLEAISVLSGEVEEDRCLAKATTLRQLLYTFLLDLHDTYSSE